MNDDNSKGSYSKHVDMSDMAILRRLEKLSQLFELSQMLKLAGLSGKGLASSSQNRQTPLSDRN